MVIILEVLLELTDRKVKSLTENKHTFSLRFVNTCDFLKYKLRIWSSFYRQIYAKSRFFYVSASNLILSTYSLM